MKQLSLEEIQASQFETMVIFRDFCQRNNLRYYLAYGTLLGAVRHKGFIPWDDDVDISMPREDYDYFIAHFNECAPCCRKVISKETCSEFYLDFAKIIDGNTVVIERGQTLEIGVWVDVFPMDYVTDSKPLRTRKNRIIGLINLCLHFCPPEPRKGHAAYKNVINRMVNAVTPSREQLLEKRKRLVDGIVTPKGSNTYGLLYQSFAIYGTPTVSTSLFEPAVQLAFEGESFAAPKEYNKILTYFYGRNYMTLPPIKKQISNHHYVCCWKDAGNNA